jgi:Spy/CpxP family protein refolding chaperone
MDAARFKFAALLTAIFVAGLTAGVAAERTWLAPASAEEVREQPAGGEFTIQRFADDLQLTPEQRIEIEGMLAEFRASMKQLWGEFRPRYSTLVDSVRLDIEAVLTPEQVEQYRRLLQEQYGAGAFGAEPTD